MLQFSSLQRKYLAAALVLSRKLSANMCSGLLYLGRVIERNVNGQLENIEIANLRKPGAGGAPPYGCNLGLAPKTLRTDKRTFTTLLIKRTHTKNV